MEMARGRPALGGILERRSRQERLSVSLPTELVGYVRSRAQERSEPQSNVVAEALSRMLNDERKQSIIQGLIEDAEWHREMAREGMASAPPVRD